VPLVELDFEQFSLPITTLATSYFLTARLAARAARREAPRAGNTPTAHREDFTHPRTF
jgi:hypothetical protein